MKKTAFLIASFSLTSLNAFSAEVPIATDTGTITVKGSVYENSCSISGAQSSTLAIPTTYAADYSSKGDMSPLGKTSNLMIFCAGNANMSGIYLSVDGDPDSTDPSLYKVTTGTGKAEGVALKVFATPMPNSGALPSFALVPNQEATTIIPNRSGASPQFVWAFSAQAISVADKVTSGDLSTTLTWTARYN
ncbi:MAG: fimbrial protein [Kluyvera sp.]